MALLFFIVDIGVFARDTRLRFGFARFFSPAVGLVVAVALVVTWQSGGSSGGSGDNFLGGELPPMNKLLGRHVSTCREGQCTYQVEGSGGNGGSV